MVQSLSNFTRNALEMPKSPIPNAIVELNHKKKPFPLDMIGTILKMKEYVYPHQEPPLVYVQHSVCMSPCKKTKRTHEKVHGIVCLFWCMAPLWVFIVFKQLILSQLISHFTKIRPIRRLMWCYDCTKCTLKHIKCNFIFQVFTNMELNHKRSDPSFFLNTQSWFEALPECWRDLPPDWEACSPKDDLNIISVSKVAVRIGHGYIYIRFWAALHASDWTTALCFGVCPLSFVQYLLKYAWCNILKFNYYW